MGLTKQYLRYIPAGNFNIIASSTCNVVFVTLEGQEGRFVAVGACEHVIIWDMRLGEKAQVLSGEKSAVTSLCASPNKRHLAVGYADGNIQVFDLRSTDVLSIFSGHKYEVTELVYDQFGHKLASGSKDTDIIIWDTVAETGLCRLSGHKGPITKLSFMTKMQVLISSSKDTLVKFWDFDTKNCFRTLVGHRSEVWSCVLMKDDQYLVTGCSDAQLRVWKLSIKDENDRNKDDASKLSIKLELVSIDDNDDLTHPLQCHEVGTLLRGGKGRVVSLGGDSNGQLLGCHGSDGLLELFHFLPDDEVQTRFKKRLKKQRKKQGEKNETEADVETVPNESTLLCLTDEVKRLKPIQLSSKPKSLDLVLGRGGELRVAVCLNNNTVELHTLKTLVKDSEPLCLRSIANQGHHSEVRAVAFSSDNLAIVSGSGESVKMWSRPTQACIRTVETGYILCLAFAPGDRHVLAGCKDGKLLIIDIASGDILEEVLAHTQELWSISLTPDMIGCVSGGGGDQTVKFWQFELIAPEKSESTAKVLSLIHSRTLKLEDSVLCLRLSQNGKFLAVALLDTTVKIFFVDTFKFYLSLYGHKLPVLIMDISSDSTLIATGSADRNVKIWGMDFGDCHKSIFAHDDSITGLQFIPRTHYLFTCGKDGKVKQWDCDTFNKVTTLQGHTGEAYGLAVSPNGKFVVSCGSDRVLRLYEKSDQVLVLEDEEEMEREQQEALSTGEKTMVPGHSELSLPSKKTFGSEKAAENILECLEICEQYRQQLAEHKALQAGSTQVLPVPQPPLLMQAYKVSTPDDFLLETIKKIRSSDLEEALLILPFSSVCEVLQLLPGLIKRGDNIELICKLSVFLLKLHHSPIVANHTLLSTLGKLHKLAMKKLQDLRDMVGYNFYGLQFLEKEIETSEGIQLFRDLTVEKQKATKKRRQREKLKRSVMVLNS